LNKIEEKIERLRKRKGRSYSNTRLWKSSKSKRWRT
jgi:hypothetical protein